MHTQTHTVRSMFVEQPKLHLPCRQNEKAVSKNYQTENLKCKASTNAYIQTELTHRFK